MAVFDDVKVGEVVFVVISVGGGRTKRLMKNVSRITKTMIIVENYRFRKDGLEVGRELYSTVWRTLEKYDEEVWQKELKERRKEYVKNPMFYQNLTDSQYERIYQILQEKRK